jgi:hypothetical protein
MLQKRPISPALLGKAAIRIGASQADHDLGLALASLGLVLAGLRRGPQPVSLPDLADLAAPSSRPSIDLTRPPSWRRRAASSTGSPRNRMRLLRQYRLPATPDPSLYPRIRLGCR